MPALALQLIALLALGPLGPGDHNRSITLGESTRSYLVHVPPKYDAKKPTPVVLVLHGAGMNGKMMASFCGLNKKADEAGFIAVYPNGTGLADLLLTWNAGGVQVGQHDHLMTWRSLPSCWMTLPRWSLSIRSGSMSRGCPTAA